MACAVLDVKVSDLAATLQEANYDACSTKQAGQICAMLQVSEWPRMLPYGVYVQQECPDLSVHLLAACYGMGFSAPASITQ